MSDPTTVATASPTVGASGCSAPPPGPEVGGAAAAPPPTRSRSPFPPLPDPERPPWPPEGPPSAERTIVNETERSLLPPPGRRPFDRTAGHRYEQRGPGGAPAVTYPPSTPDACTAAEGGRPRAGSRLPARREATMSAHAVRCWSRCVLVLLLALGVSTGTATPAGATPAGASPAAAAASDDFAGLVDIGGRRLYLECRGTGGPTVVLVAGYRASGRYWTDDLLQPDAPRTMVLPRLAGTTRVCAYDRPGTYAPAGEDVLPSRSDPVPQPRTETDAVAELHALLGAAGVPGPYVLGAHSLGGLMARLYAATYPDEVAGLVLVDAFSERIEALMTPEQWAALVKLNADGGSDTVLPLPGYGPLETIPFGGGNPLMRRAAAATPLPAMPLAMVAHVRPFELPGTVGGMTPETVERIFREANEWQATLAPRGRFFAAHASGHDVHQDQPALVAEAIRQVVAGVRDPDAWSDLTACCAAAPQGATAQQAP